MTYRRVCLSRSLHLCRRDVSTDIASEAKPLILGVSAASLTCCIIFLKIMGLKIIEARRGRGPGNGLDLLSG